MTRIRARRLRRHEDQDSFPPVLWRVADKVSPASRDRTPPLNRRKCRARFPCRGRHRKPSRLLLRWRFATPDLKPPRQLAPHHAFMRSFLARGMSGAALPRASIPTGRGGQWDCVDAS
jgi:hypothetical protein